MRIFITGGTGFIGRELIRQLSGSSHTFTCMGHILPDRAQIDCICWRDFDAVIHLAAAGVNFGARKWDECMSVNFQGTRELLESIKASGSAPVIYISGSVRENETATTLNYWDDPYYVTKKLSGIFVDEWRHDYRGTILRPLIGRCKGPGQVEAVVSGIIDEIQCARYSLTY